MTIIERREHEKQFEADLHRKYEGKKYPEVKIGDRVMTKHGVGTVIDTYDVYEKTLPIVKHDIHPICVTGNPFSFDKLFYWYFQYEPMNLNVNH